MAVDIRHNNQAEYWRDVSFHARVKYETSDRPADVESIAYVRQNAWGKQKTSNMDAVATGLLSLPYAHTKEVVEEFQRSQTIPEGPPKLVADLPIGSIVYIPNGRNGTLVRLVSEVKSGILPLAIARRERTCGHSFTRASADCIECGNSVISVDDDLRESLGNGYILEPFYTLYRECDPVAKVSLENVDLRVYAGANSTGKKILHWRRVETPRVFDDDI